MRLKPETAKTLLKFVVGGVSAFVVGKAYQAGKKIEERVDAYYDEHYPKTEPKTKDQDN